MSPARSVPRSRTHYLNPPASGMGWTGLTPQVRRPFTGSLPSAITSHVRRDVRRHGTLPHRSRTCLLTLTCVHGGQWKGVRHLFMQSARAEGNSRSVTPAGFRKVSARAVHGRHAPSLTHALGAGTATLRVAHHAVGNGTHRIRVSSPGWRCGLQLVPQGIAVARESARTTAVANAPPSECLHDALSQCVYSSWAANAVDGDGVVEPALSAAHASACNSDRNVSASCFADKRIASSEDT